MVSVSDDFKAFRSNYLIPSATVGTISYRYKRITKQLNTDFWNTTSDTSHSLYVGSYGRDSAAKGISDLDVSFQLPYAIYDKYNNYSGNGQSALLQAIRSSIQNTYSSTYVGGDGQVVALDFDDGIRFEVLPIFHNNDGSFTFADTNGGGSWKTCNPRAEMNAFLSRNAETNGNLKALCRMMRVWRKYHNVPISGMLIDTLAYNFIQGWAYKDKSYLYHDYLARDFLLYMSVTDANQTHWRAPGSSSYVYSKGNFRRQAAASYADAVKAINYGTNENDWSYRQSWRAVFGPTFP